MSTVTLKLHRIGDIPISRNMLVKAEWGPDDNYRKIDVGAEHRKWVANQLYLLFDYVEAALCSAQLLEGAAVAPYTPHWIQLVGTCRHCGRHVVSEGPLDAPRDSVVLHLAEQLVTFGLTCHGRDDVREKELKRIDSQESCGGGSQGQQGQT